MSNLDQYFFEKLRKRQEEGTLRKLSVEKTLIDFCSNDYLGLSRSQELWDFIEQKFRALALRYNGSTGSRLLSGNSLYAEQVEERLASIFQSSKVLLFNSGYTANLGVISSIAQKGDTILYDELAHACIKDGARLSLANRYSFKHNDLNDLENKIKKSTGRVLVVVESIYSMDGDACPLAGLVALKSKYDITIILDEAHSTGVYGEGGNGYACSLNLHHNIDIRIYTFGKAIGVHGACVAGSDHLINYLINFARPFIYTTAMTPHSLCSIDAAFEFIDRTPSLKEQLRKRIDFFLAKTKSITNRTDSNSSIQTVVVECSERARSLALHLQNNGFDIRPILSPTVPKGKERIRICLHAFNTDEEVSKLADLLIFYNN
ncbi:pyridoxal phosphate-dependent aminotransferase family protein [Fulvivirgaceae bacterium PWU20]|uniref:Pyridoxal phosphate-dependent aminotransferase family protein n=2 Tax=Chryseosolibacter indicus TaxID=2782351 RepID=A0ABS5VVZ1_9BACT|nr:pyridoxal phosphate-dependent aminotransferase family protein [Chryseosolibacter indicus]